MGDLTQRPPAPSLDVTIVAALDASTDANPHVLDLDMTAHMAANPTASCTDDSTSGWAVEVQSGGGSFCYEHVHPDSYNVFDFSYFRWARAACP